MSHQSLKSLRGSQAERGRGGRVLAQLWAGPTPPAQRVPLSRRGAPHGHQQAPRAEAAATWKGWALPHSAGPHRAALGMERGESSFKLQLPISTMRVSGKGRAAWFCFFKEKSATLLDPAPLLLQKHRPFFLAFLPERAPNIC